MADGYEAIWCAPALGTDGSITAVRLQELEQAVDRMVLVTYDRR